MASNTTTGPQEPTQVVIVTPTVRPAPRQAEPTGTNVPRSGNALPHAPTVAVHGSSTAPPAPGVPRHGEPAVPPVQSGERSSPPPRPTPPAPNPSRQPAESAATLDAAVAQLNKALNDSGRPTQYRVDRSAGTPVIQEVNPANGKVIAELSAEEFPALARSLGALGIFVNQHA